MANILPVDGEQLSGRWRIQLPHLGGDGAGEGSIACREVPAYGPSATAAGVTGARRPWTMSRLVALAPSRAVRPVRRRASRRRAGHARSSAGFRWLSGTSGHGGLGEMSAPRYDNPQALRQALADRLRPLADRLRPLAEESGMKLSALLQPMTNQAAARDSGQVPERTRS